MFIVLISIMQNLTVNIETYTSVTTHTTYNVLAYTDDGSGDSIIVVCDAIYDVTD